MRRYERPSTLLTSASQEPLWMGAVASARQRLVMRICRGEPTSALENRVILVETHRGALTSYQIKRLLRQENQWLLTSDNPSGPAIDAGHATVPIARLERVISPSELAPPVGTVMNESLRLDVFGLIRTADALWT